MTQLAEIDLSRLEKSATYREAAETELRDLGYRELELAERRRSLIEQVSRLKSAPRSRAWCRNCRSRPPLGDPSGRPDHVSSSRRIARWSSSPASPRSISTRSIPAKGGAALSSFSSRTTPEIDGVLSRVSPDTLVDQATQIPYYRAEVTIPATELENSKARPHPGMPVEVYIQTGERSPMAYLVKPLSDYFIRAFREN